jgi:hypothetical protein
MSPISSAHSSPCEPGQLLRELDERQDEVLERLNDLEAKLCEVLRGLGVSIEPIVDQELV